jgi:hypothetical protein
VSQIKVCGAPFTVIWSVMQPGETATAGPPFPFAVNLTW